MEQHRNPVILTIDDEDTIRDSFRLFLEDFNYQVLEAGSGREGLEIFAREKPDVVLCDLRMPEIDGLEIIERIKQDSPDTPIIVISGTGVISDAIEAIHRGAWNYLLKPIQNMSALLHAINQAIERSRLIIENRTYQEHLKEEVTKRTKALQKAVENLNQSHIKLKNSEKKYRSIFENLQDVYLEMSLDGKVTEISPSISNFSKYCREDVLNIKIKQIFPDLQDYDSLFTQIKDKGEMTNYELYLQDKDETLIPCSLNARYQMGADQTDDKICATLRNETDRKQAEIRIEYLAYYDALTELPNRRLLLDRLEQNISRARRYGHYGAMLFLDLDRFKNINDSLGHPVGDALLKDVSRRLVQNLRAEDTVSRLGGDEFVMLLSDLGEDSTNAAATAQQKAETIKVQLAEKYKIDGHELHVTPSIGVAMFPSNINNYESGNDILRHADTAMYRAKDDGRDTIRFSGYPLRSSSDIK